MNTLMRVPRHLDPFGFIDDIFEGLDAPQWGFRDSGESYDISLDVPGFDRSELKIEVLNDLLRVSGKTKGRVVDRVYNLPQGVDLDKDVDALLDKGVLTIKVAKAEKSQPRVIEVQETKGLPSGQGPPEE